MAPLVQEIAAAVEDVLQEPDIAEALDRAENGDREPTELSPRDSRLDADLLQEVKSQLRSFLTRRLAATEWDRFLGPLLTHKQVIAVTGMTKQSLSQATRVHRILKLQTDNRRHLYPRWQFTEEAPARPLPALQPLFRTWSTVDPTGWTGASWICSPQVELEDASTPLDVVRHDDAASQQRLLVLAQHSVERLLV